MGRTALGLALVAALVAAVGAEPGKDDAKPTPQRIEALGLEATFDLPRGFVAAIDTGESDDPETRKAKALPNADFEAEHGWWNEGEILAKLFLRLGRKDFKGTPRELADRCVVEIREKWPAFKSTRPAIRAVTLGSTPALYVALENAKEPPYRVHFVALVAEGKGCCLFCYGWGPQATVVDLSGGQMPDSARRIAEEARRLSPEKLRKQAELFKAFEKAIVPTLRIAPPPPKDKPPAAPPR